MKFELKRGFRSHYFLFIILLNIFCVVLGYILTKTVDKITLISFEEFVLSVYTVYTQFGVFLFSTVMIMQYSIDYKEKNILFYKALKTPPLLYFIFKLSMVVLGTIVGTLTTTFILCALYKKWGMFIIIFLKTEAVMIYYSLISSLLGYIMENFLIAFFVNMSCWITGILISGISPYLKIFAYYDSSSTDFNNYLAFLEGNIPIQNFYKTLINNYIFDIMLFVGVLLLVFIFKKRWIKNGI